MSDRAPERGSLAAFVLVAPLALGLPIVGRWQYLETLAPVLALQAVLLVLTAVVLRDRKRVGLLEGALLLLLAATPVLLHAAFCGYVLAGPELDRELWGWLCVDAFGVLLASAGQLAATAVGLASRGSAPRGFGGGLCAIVVAALVYVGVEFAEAHFRLFVGGFASAALSVLAYVWIATGLGFEDPNERTRARIARTMVAFALAAAFIHDGLWAGFPGFVHCFSGPPPISRPYGWALLDFLAARERLVLQLLLPAGLLLRTWLGRASRPRESASTALVFALAGATLIPALLGVSYTMTRGSSRSVAKAHHALHIPSVPPTIDLAGVGQPPARYSLPWPLTTTLSEPGTRFFRGWVHGCGDVGSQLHVEPGLAIASPERLPEGVAAPALEVADGTPWHEVVRALERHSGGDTRLDFCMPMPSPFDGGEPEGVRPYPGPPGWYEPAALPGPPGGYEPPGLPAFDDWCRLGTRVGE